jgi:type IV pilus assembly protein PilY1
MSNAFGWYMDFPVVGERVTVHPLLSGDQKNITVVSNIPSGDVCSVGGQSYVYFMDTQPAKSYPSPTGMVLLVPGNALSVGATNLTLESGARKTVVTTSAGGTQTLGNDTPALANKVRRVSWRELQN